MKSTYALLSTIILSAVTFAACKQDNKKTDTSSPTPSTAKPALVLYIVTVDKLNLREEPNKSGKVLAQIAENTIVEGTGDVSDNREEATLRNLTYNEPYHKIIVSSPAQHTGWAYGGALMRIYAGPKDGSPDFASIAQLATFLRTLDAKKLDSGKKAWDYVTAQFGTTNGPLADAAFILLERFLRRMEAEGEFYQLTEQMNWAENDYQAIAENKFDMNKYPLSKSLAENGFGLEQGEGMIFPTADWNKLRAFFGPKTTPTMKAFLDQQTHEINHRAWDDGGIIISLEELANRSAFWEKFNRENPYFLLNEQTKQSEQWTRLVLVNGADNTPTYDYETQAIDERYKQVWAYIQQKYPGTELAKRAKEIADLCAAEGWKRTKKVEDWQMKYAEEN
ncbi:MAG: hypothetical protein KIS77_07210 [Saprospiraceae bacterium]|nr:hypothetical protein [Saprospiraceae bacterium]